MIKSLNDEILKIQNVINTNNQTIYNYKQTLSNIKKSGIVDKEKEIASIKQEIESKREPYKKHKTDLKIQNLLFDKHSST